MTPPLSLQARPRPQHWNRPGLGVRQRIFRGCGCWSRRSLGGACDYFRRVPPGPGLRRPVLDTVSDLCRCASVPTTLHSFPSSPDTECRTGFREGMALSGQGNTGGIFRGPLTSSIPTVRDIHVVFTLSLSRQNPGSQRVAKGSYWINMGVKMGTKARESQVYKTKVPAPAGLLVRMISCGARVSRLQDQ